MSLSVPPAGPNRLGKRRGSLKRVFLVFIFSLGACTLLAEDSKEFTFLGNLLDALTFCRASIDLRITEKRPAVKMIADTQEANVGLEKARTLLEPYAKEPDTIIATQASRIINAVDILTYSHDALNGKLRGVAGLIPNGFDDTVSETARFRSQSKRGWDEFFSSLQSPEMKMLVSKIPKEEKRILLEKIQGLFPQAGQEAQEENGLEPLLEEKRQLHRRFGATVAAIKDLLSD